MRSARFEDKIIITSKKNPLRFVDLNTKKLYKYPAVYLEESSEMPIYKWWCNPILWLQWRKIKKIVRRHNPNIKLYIQTTPTGHNAFYKKQK